MVYNEKKCHRQERQIQALILRYLENKGVCAYKVTGSNRRGCPDILACYRGWFLGLEVKSNLAVYKPFGGSKPFRSTQIKSKEDIEKAGGFHSFVDSVEDVEKVLKIIEENTNG